MASTTVPAMARAWSRAPWVVAVLGVSGHFDAVSKARGAPGQWTKPGVHAAGGVASSLWRRGAAVTVRREMSDSLVPDRLERPLGARSWREHGPAAEPGRVLRHDGVAVQVATPSGERMVKLRRGVEPLTVGDWLALDGEQVLGLLDRASLLRRRAAGRRGPPAARRQPRPRAPRVRARPARGGRTHPAGRGAGVGRRRPPAARAHQGRPGRRPRGHGRRGRGASTPGSSGS